MTVADDPRVKLPKSFLAVTLSDKHSEDAFEGETPSGEEHKEPGNSMDVVS